MALLSRGSLLLPLPEAGLLLPFPPRHGWSDHTIPSAALKVPSWLYTLQLLQDGPAPPWLTSAWLSLHSCLTPIPPTSTMTTQPSPSSFHTNIPPVALHLHCLKCVPCPVCPPEPSQGLLLSFLLPEAPLSAFSGPPFPWTSSHPRARSSLLVPSKLK